MVYEVTEVTERADRKRYRKDMWKFAFTLIIANGLVVLVLVLLQAGV